MASTSEASTRAREETRKIESFMTSNEARELEIFKSLSPQKAFEKLFTSFWATSPPEGPKKRLKVGWELTCSLLEKGDTKKALEILLGLDQDKLAITFEHALIKVKIVDITTHQSFPKRIRCAQEALNIVKDALQTMLAYQMSPAGNAYEIGVCKRLLAAAESILARARDDEALAKGLVASEDTDLGLTEDAKAGLPAASRFVVDGEKKKEIVRNLELLSSMLAALGPEPAKEKRS